LIFVTLLYQFCGESLSRSDWLDCDRAFVTGVLDPLRQMKSRSEFEARFPDQTLRWVFTSADQTTQPIPGHHAGLSSSVILVCSRQ
jgi:hypothetical protein